MTKLFKHLLLATSILSAPVFANAQDWEPPGPIKLLIGFAAGGGADTQARLVAQGIEERYGWTILPEQVEGNSGLSLAAQLTSEPADGTAIGMVVSETLTYSALAAGDPELQLDQFTSLATTASFELGLVAMTGSAYDSWDKVVAAAEGGEAVRFGVASDRQADVAWLFGQSVGLDFNIVPVQGGAGVMNGLRGGDLDVGWVAGAQSKAVQQGEMVNIVSGISQKLGDSPDAPTITDLGGEYLLDGYFMFIAPGGLDPSARAALGSAIADVLNDPESEANQLVESGFGGADVLTGEDVDARMLELNEEAEALLSAANES
ncbi:tripartite tricarboxylate transporter substrate-binding protein [Paracoccus albus]|uniref:tripartite tricarboxylate transporter substrate-binding protein n=1 Tax=Paracoccus albus TaxID=3017784 RepID=UPI0022F0A827|nr:tripartite tricarboxylate transporter substrate-binding protein [Paracoccus albus]WBU60565.1 tripartite tricarboxylate transporter substrate-binding protein [Paracoccus albus]